VSVENPTSSVKLPSKKALLRGIQIFIFFTILGIGLGFWWKQPASFGALLKQINWWFFALVIPLVALNYLLGGLRFRIFFNGKVLPYISLWKCVQVDWANSFVAAITPFQTGGAPAQLYLLWRHGARVSDGILVALVNFAATIVFFLVASMFAVFFIPVEYFGVRMEVFTRSALIFLGIFLGLILLILFFPRVGLTAVRKILYFFPLRSRRLLSLRNRFLQLVEEGAENFQHAFRQIMVHQKKQLIYTIAATFVLYFSKYVIGYLLAISLQKGVAFAPFVSLQIIQLVMLYFTPTPGASGLAELSSVWLIGYLLSENTIILFTILWRFFTTILGAIIGGFVLMFDLKRLMG